MIQLKKRILTLTLALVMLLSLFPTAALAAASGNAVNIGAFTGGSVAANPSPASNNTSVTLTVTPDGGKTHPKPVENYADSCYPYLCIFMGKG